MSSHTLPGPCFSHPHQLAFEECLGCASPACHYCLGDDEHVCPSCRDAVEPNGAIAFESTNIGFVRSIFGTIADVLQQPGKTLGDVGAGPVAPAISWMIFVWASAAMLMVAISFLVVALASGAGGSAVMSVPTAQLMRRVVPIVAPTLAMLTVGGCLAAGITTHVIGTLLGGRAPLSTPIRAVGYSQTIALVMAPFFFVSLIPKLAVIVAGVFVLALLVWVAGVFVSVARTQYGLSAGKAVVAGATPSLIVLSVIVGVPALMVLFGAAQGLTRLAHELVAHGHFH